MLYSTDLTRPWISLSEVKMPTNPKPNRRIPRANPDKNSFLPIMFYCF